MFSCGLMHTVWWHIRSAVFFAGFWQAIFFGIQHVFPSDIRIKEKQEMGNISCFLFDIRGGMPYYF